MSGNTEAAASEKTEREHLYELAMSDRPTAPVYKELYARKYGVEAAEDTSVGEQR